MHVLYLIQEYYVKSNTEEEHLDCSCIRISNSSKQSFFENNLLILYGVRDSIHYAGIKNVSMKGFWAKKN